MRRSQPRPHYVGAARSTVRLTAFLAVLFCLAGLLTGIGSTANAVPSNPSDGAINAAQAKKTELATQVGTLSAKVAQMQSQLNQLRARLELAEQRVAYALQKLEQAKTAAVTAAANVVNAQQNVEKAQNAFNGYMQQLYMGDPLTGTTGALLTANDPGALLQRTTLEAYQSNHQISAIGDLQTATVAKSNADATARKAVLNQQNATNEAQAAKDAAAGAFAAAKSQKAQLDTTLASTQNQLNQARYRLDTLNNQRLSYEAWQQQRQRQLERQRQREAARQREIERQLQQQQQNQQNGGRSGGGGGGGGGGSSVPPGGGGSWTAAKGQTAVNRAMQWLGTPYSWAGGNASGPTLGVCAGDGAFNDCNVVGFDCSGLAMYAWAQYPFAHYAATQYLQGSFHPGVDQLMPGDLVFWSADGSVGGIHHVAIYIGSGNVIQAPASGDVIKITPLNNVDWGYFGATRPLT